MVQADSTVPRISIQNTESVGLTMPEEAIANNQTPSAVNIVDDTPEDSQRDEMAISSVPYTIFQPKEKNIIILLVGFATITSPLTATVYFPLLPMLRSQFNVSSQDINLTLTIYIIFQAISPAIFGPLSDSVGRRPVYLVTLAVYGLGNLGLALNKHNYAALLLLRSIQSLGASATFAVSYGIVADICVPSERGRTLGWVSMALNLGTCIGPMLGSLVVYLSGDTEWIFAALVVIAFILLFLVGLFLPETGRNIVGNGSQTLGEPLWQEPWWISVKRILNRSRTMDKQSTVVRTSRSWSHASLKNFRIRNPLTCLRVIFYGDAFLCLWMHSSFYAVDYSMAAAVPDIYKTIYGFNELEIGLSYLPRGVGIIFGGYCNGKLMDYNYKFTAKKVNWTVDEVNGDNLTKFPIELARSRGSFVLLAISTATLVGYSWAVQEETHFSVPLVLQFIQGFLGTSFYTTYNTLLVDSFPDSPSTAAATASIVRCTMAATAVAVLQPLLDAVGRGWYFTVLGLWSGGCGCIAVWLLRRNGMKWRQKRISRTHQTSLFTS
jgi:multidrug resistance protein